MLCKPKNVTAQQSLSLKANKSRSSLCSKSATVAWLVDSHDSHIELNQKKKEPIVPLCFIPFKSNRGRNTSVYHSFSKIDSSKDGCTYLRYT